MAAEQNAPSTGEPQATDELSISQAPSEVIADDRSIEAPTSNTWENVVNPLAKLPISDLNKAVKDFVCKDEVLTEHLELLQRGARLAQDETAALARETQETTLSLEQREYLEHGERHTGLMKQSKYLKGSLLAACLAGIIQGWTQSAINGSNIGMSDDFNLHYRPDDPERNTGDLWTLGALTATPFLAGGVLAPLISDPLQYQLLGRRGAIAIACLLSIAATVGQSFSKSPAQLAGCRVITGLTLAAKASIAPLLVAEISPDHLRGNFLSTWQLSDAFGIFLGFSANLATLNISASDKVVWRIQIATILIPTIVLLFVIYFIPESPRYLMKHGEYSKAFESFKYLRPPPTSALVAARELTYAHFQLQTECQNMENSKSGKSNSSDQHNGKGDPEKTPAILQQTVLYNISRTNYFQRVSQTFRDARSRRALLCASTAMLSQQLTGINTIAFLSATLLSGVRASNRSGAWVGFGIGLCNFLFGLPAFWLLDIVGRASMLLLGFFPMFIFLLVVAFCFKTDQNGNARVPLVGVFGMIYIAAYSPTAGTSPFTISAEVFPLTVREVGHSIAVAVNFLGLGFVLLIFPSLSDAMGGYTESLSLFAALNIVAFGLCFCFVPETKGRSLEELQYIFGRPLRKHIKYRVQLVIPWLWRTLLVRLKRLKASLQGNGKALEQLHIEKLILFHDWERFVNRPGAPYNTDSETGTTHKEETTQVITEPPVGS